MGAVTLARPVSLFLPDESRTEMDDAQSGSRSWTHCPLRADKDGSQDCLLRLCTSLDKDALGNLVAWGMVRGASGAP